VEDPLDGARAVTVCLGLLSADVADPGADLEAFELLEVKRPR
jgi:hypothetical protein